MAITLLLLAASQQLGGTVTAGSASMDHPSELEEGEAKAGDSHSPNNTVMSQWAPCRHPARSRVIDAGS